MKIYTKHSTGIFDRWTRFLGAMLAIVLMVPAVAVSQSTAVNLGTAGNFAILAKTTITTTGTTHITGDIGISPAAASLITGFTLVADASTQFSTSSLITGKVYASDYGVPTPTIMDTAIANMQTAYTNAAGRTLPDSINMGAGDITGKTITHGLYKWGTGLLISAGGVTLSGSATDVWIFQIAGDLTVASGAIVTLSGGALASNIFWAVAGQVTLGTTAQMEGNILCQTQIAMSNGATLNGRALAQTAVTLIANTVTKVGSGSGSSSLLKDTLTFKVNMSVQAIDGKFNMALDTVRVVGSLNGWSTTDTTVRMTRNSLSDSIYVLTTVLDSSVLHSTSIAFKYFKTVNGYENVANNRTYNLVNGKHSTPVYWFSDDSIPHPQVTIQFRVNMSIQMRQLGFQPALGDIIRVTGNFNGWTNLSSTDTLKNTNGFTDSIYTSKSITVNQGDDIQYKFLKTLRGGLDWENNIPGGGNRQFIVPVGGGPTPLNGTARDYFDYDSVNTPAVQINLVWATDISAFTTLGWFNPLHDTIQVRGAFTGWGAQKTQPDQFAPNIWSYVSQNLISPIGNTMSYKFYMQIDSADAVNRFPGLIWNKAAGATNDNTDEYFYEHPATTGDGNLQYTVTGATVQTPPQHYFSEINPLGLLAAGDTVNVTLKVNMGPAKRYSDPFLPATDTLFLSWQNAIWRSKSGGSTPFPAFVRMFPQTVGDSVYSVTFKVIGPTHYNMLYNYEYRHADGTKVTQAGGLGGSNIRISRYIAKSGATWPKSYTAPTDQWVHDGPYIAETPQFTTGVAGKTPVVPTVYNLFQNYPNPFNPTTNISYSLPQQSKVSLKVYNILGQMVMELFNGTQPSGNHVVAFDASKLASGVYFYRLEAGSYLNVKKMVLLK